MKNKFGFLLRRVYLLLISAGFCAPVAYAQLSTATITASADTWVRETGADKTVNYGSDTTWMTRHSSTGYREIGFLKFDLSGYVLPQNTSIDSAKLLLTMVYNQSTGGVINILPMDDQNDNWDENAITWSTGRPDSVQGAGPIASLSVAKLNPQVSAENGTLYNWDITTQVLTELSDSNKILSVAVYPNYKTDINVKFLSKESAKATLRPKLVLYLRTTDPYSFMMSAKSDPYKNRIDLSWKTTIKSDLAYFKMLHSTDGIHYTYLARVDNQPGIADTVSYQYADLAPAMNLTHYYKIEAVLKDSTTHLSTAVSAAYGITGMISRNQWELSQIPSTQATSARLMQSLQMADFNPVGLRMEPAIPLIINVQQLSGTALPKLIVGTYDRQTVTTYDLSVGMNTINNASGGDLYIKYSADNPSSVNKIRITFQSGYQQMPLYILGSTTHQQWLDQLAVDSVSPNVTLIANRVFIVTSKQKAVQYQAADQDTLLTYMDDIMRTEDEISGLDNSSPLNAPAYENKLMLLEKASGNPDATSLGRVRIPSGSIKWILDPAYITENGGWGIFHEIGHHHQQYPWSWKACTEVTVNIYSMAAKRFFHPDATGMASSDWDKTMDYLATADSLKDYDGSANYVKLGLWNQLGMAYGDSFYQTLHKRTRAEKIVPVGDKAEMRLLMLYACEISGQDLSSFFRKWGLAVDASVYGEIASLGLVQPTTDPSALREDWAVTVQRSGAENNLDSILLTASAYGPEGVKKVEFYANGTKIGASTSRPFNYVWKNVAPGDYSIVAKAIGSSDTIISSPAVIMTQKAISIIHPLDNSSFLTGSGIDMLAAVATGSAVASVDFYANGTKIGTANTAPYQYHWTVAQDGVYKLQAVVNYQTAGQDSSQIAGVISGAFFPVADAYVRDGGNADINFGKDTTLVVKKDGSSYNRISYLKFDPGSFTGSSDSAILTLHIASANHSLAATQWQLWLCKQTSFVETALTWNNRPSIDTLLGTIDTKSSGEIQFTIPGDILALRSTDAALTLALMSTTINGTSDVSFYSRDAASVNLRPQLKILPPDTQLSAVPVTYSPLQAILSNKNKEVLLRWQTYTETSAATFVIEHSLDGRRFFEVGRTAALGNATSGHLYHFIHSKPASGTNYYRFRELSTFGAAQFSNTVLIHSNISNAATKSGWGLYPNPTFKGGKTVIALTEGLHGPLQVTVTNLEGKRVIKQLQTTPLNGKTIHLNTAVLKKGVYFVQLWTENGEKIGQSKTLRIQ